MGPHFSCSGLLRSAQRCRTSECPRALLLIISDCTLRRQVLATQGRARASRMTLPHNVCYTPMFMPVGTQGARLHCN